MVLDSELDLLGTGTGLYSMYDDIIYSNRNGI